MFITTHGSLCIDSILVVRGSVRHLIIPVNVWHHIKSHVEALIWVLLTTDLNPRATTLIKVLITTDWTLRATALIWVLLIANLISWANLIWVLLIAYLICRVTFLLIIFWVQIWPDFSNHPNLTSILRTHATFHRWKRLMPTPFHVSQNCFGKILAVILFNRVRARAISTRTPLIFFAHKITVFGFDVWIKISLGIFQMVFYGLVY